MTRDIDQQNAPDFGTLEGVGQTHVQLAFHDEGAQNLLAAVENERGLLIVITSFSFLVVAFLIGSTQSMLVVEKTREIGVLRSLGASVAGTASVFLGNGLFIEAPHTGDVVKVSRLAGRGCSLICRYPVRLP